MKNFKTAYPVIISKGQKFMLVSVPDLEIDTQGNDIVDAIEMARDAISLWCITHLEEGRELPKPSELSNIEYEDGDIITLVDIDLDFYRRKLLNRTIRKNVTIPAWLNDEAEKNNINFSKTLTEALLSQIGTDRPRL